MILQNTPEMIKITGKEASGPQGQIFVGNLKKMAKNPLDFLMSSFRKYGDLSRISLGSADLYLLAHPEHAQHVLQGNVKNYTKRTRGFKVMRTTLGNGLVTSEGEFWRRQRRIIQPAFHRQRIEAYTTIMTNAAQAMLNAWEAKAHGKQVFDVLPEMMEVTLKIAGETLFGTNVSSDTEAIGTALSALLKRSRRAVYQLLPDWIYTPGKAQANQAIDDLNTVVYRIIAEHRNATESSDDLLTMMLEAQDEETGERMTDLQLRDEVMTLLLAGHETTANALTWCVYLLAKFPEAQRQLRQETATVLGERIPTMEDLSQLPYSAKVVKEAMRLYPPAWAVTRYVMEDDELDGFRIPARSAVLLSPYITHRHPDFWENPEGFDPEHFNQEQEEALHKYAYFPFGGGPRLCIGHHFAMIETQLIISMIAQRYRLQLDIGQNIELQPAITLRPKHGVRMTLHSW